MTPQRELEHLLYEDELGNWVGLDEVQLLRPVPAGRISPLHGLLESKSLFIVIDTAKILAAWGDDKGLAKIESLVDSRVHEHVEVSPHRIEGYDNIYDELAYAVYLYGLSGKNRDWRMKVFAKFLGLYGECGFESGLKYALLRSSMPELAEKVKAAIDRSLTVGHAYQASQLLPVLANWQPTVASALLPKILAVSGGTPDPAVNVAEALGYFDTAQARAKLSELIQCGNPVVANEARSSLKRIAGRQIK